MPDPISRLELAKTEIDKTFGDGFAAAHPEVLIAVVNAASSDWAAQLLARSLRDVAVALIQVILAAEPEPEDVSAGLDHFFRDNAKHDELRRPEQWHLARFLKPWGWLSYAAGWSREGSET